MKTLKTFAIASLLLASSMASAGGNNIAVRCVGDTNMGDELDIEFRMNGDCEGYFGKTVYCESELIMNKAAHDLEKGERSKLFVKSVDNTMVYENQLVVIFSWKGKVLDMMSWENPVQAYDNLDAIVNFGGGRTTGEAKCRRVRGPRIK